MRLKDIQDAIRKVLEGMKEDHRHKLNLLTDRAVYWVRLWDGKTISPNAWTRWVKGQVS